MTSNQVESLISLLADAEEALVCMTDERDRLRAAILAHREAVKCCEECAAAVEQDAETNDGRLWSNLLPHHEVEEEFDPYHTEPWLTPPAGHGDSWGDDR